MRRPSYVDLVVVLILSGLALGLTVAPPSISGLRPLLAVLLVFILPGYALLAAAFPDQTFDFPEHLLLIIVISVAVSITGGLLLHITPLGIQLSTWSSFLSGITGLATFVALLRRSQRAPTQGLQLQVKPNFAQGILLAHALVLIGVAFVVGVKPASKDDFQGYSLLWLLPSEVDQQTTLRLGVRSMEFAPAQYRLVIKADQQIAQEWPLIELSPKKQWETVITLPGELAKRVDVSAELYRLDQPDQVYRQVVLRGATTVPSRAR